MKCPTEQIMYCQTYTFYQEERILYYLVQLSLALLATLLLLIWLRFAIEVKRILPEDDDKNNNNSNNNLAVRKNE